MSPRPLGFAGMRENRNIASSEELYGHRVVPALGFVVFLESPAQASRFHTDNRIRAGIELRAAIEDDAAQHGLLELICRTIQNAFDRESQKAVEMFGVLKHSALHDAVQLGADFTLADISRHCSVLVADQRHRCMPLT